MADNDLLNSIVLTALAVPPLALAVILMYLPTRISTTARHRVWGVLALMTIALPIAVAAGAEGRRVFVVYDEGGLLILAFLLQFLTTPPAIIGLAAVALANRQTDFRRWSVASLAVGIVYGVILVVEILNFEMH